MASVLVKHISTSANTIFFHHFTVLCTFKLYHSAWSAKSTPRMYLVYSSIALGFCLSWKPVGSFLDRVRLRKDFVLCHLMYVRSPVVTVIASSVFLGLASFILCGTPLRFILSVPQAPVCCAFKSSNNVGEEKNYPYRHGAPSQKLLNSLKDPIQSNVLFLYHPFAAFLDPVCSSYHYRYPSCRHSRRLGQPKTTPLVPIYVAFVGCK